VNSKKNQRWLWHAIDHQTGDVLAYVFRELKKLFESFGIKHFYTDDWRSYKRNISPEQHAISNAIRN